MHFNTILKKHQNMFIVLLLAATGVFAYYPILKNEFVYDDYFTILGNPAIQTNNNPLYFFSNPSASDNISFSRKLSIFNYRPLWTWLSSIEFLFWGYDAGWYHALSLIIHILNSTVFFLILKILFGNEKYALLGSLIFLIHPAQVEAVSWITVQSALWSQVFAFLTIWLLLSKTNFTNKIKNLTALVGNFPYYFLIAIFSFIAVFAKEQLIVLPVIATALVWLEKKNIKDFKIDLSVIWAIAFFYLASRIYFLPHPFSTSMPLGGSYYSSFLNAANIFIFYIKLVFRGWPLIADYEGYFSIISKLDIKTFSSFLLIAVYLAILIYSCKKYPRISIGLFWFSTALLPILNFPFPAFNIIAERYLYPAIPGIIIALVGFLVIVEKWGQQEKITGGKRYFTAAAPIILILLALIYYGSITRNRIYDWKNEETLWSSAYSVSPAIKNGDRLSKALYQNAKYEEALKMYHKELLRPISYSDFAITANEEPEIKKNILNAVNKIENDMTIDVSQIYIRHKNYYEAEKILEERLENEKNSANNRLLLALTKAYLAQKKYDDAIKTIQTMSTQMPKTDELKLFLAISYFLKNKKTDAPLKELINSIQETNLRELMPLILKAYSEKELENLDKVYSLLYQKLFTMPIRHIDPYLLLAEAAKNLGHYNTAKLAYRHILNIYPSYIPARQGFNLKTP